MIDILLFLSRINSKLLILVILLILILEVFFLSFPKEIVLVYSGFAFGFLFGGIINQIGLLGAAILGFEGGYFGRFGLEKRSNHPLIQKYQNWLDKNGIKSLFLLRIFPLTPNDILSIASGFCKLKRIPYLLITFICAIPYAFLWSYLGAHSLEAMKNLFPSVFDPKSWFISFIIILAISYIIVKRGTNNT